MRFIGIKLKVRRIKLRRTLVEEIEASIIRYAPDTEDEAENENDNVEEESASESESDEEGSFIGNICDIEPMHDEGDDSSDEEDDVAGKGASGSEQTTENDDDDGGNGNGGDGGGDTPRAELNPNEDLEDQDDEREGDYFDKMYLFSPWTQDYRINKVSHASLSHSPYPLFQLLLLCNHLL